MPTDPTNASSSRLYYTYTPGSGVYEVTATLEASKYKLGGSADVASTDGGSYPDLFEKGTSLALEPLDYGDFTLVGYWKFDEGTGSVAYDYSGTNATGTWQGTLGSQWTTGKVGSGAGNFDGSTNYIKGPYTSSLDLSDLTFSAWIKLTTYSNKGIISRWTTTTDKDYILWCNGTNLDFGGSTSAATVWSNGCSTLSDSNWHHIAVTRTGQIAIIYVDNIQRANVNSAGNLAGASAATQQVNIGGYQNGAFGSAFGGIIDDVRIYNRALSAAEIQAIYNATR